MATAVAFHVKTPAALAAYLPAYAAAAAAAAASGGKPAASASALAAAAAQAASRCALDLGKWPLRVLRLPMTARVRAGRLG